ncbi:MAG: crotonase/enoyl-CoA hydratase family protein [Proteobacteria bacterium]|nr:MAG: crotonase/enoyl-CoA hydratase family protein [Pseudomonadota bacterium]
MSVAYELQSNVAVVRMDDGKANAFSFALIDALHAAFDRAEKEAKAIAWIGRAERFSGGFDLGVMRSGDMGEVAKLVSAGGRLALRAYESPLPIVIGCTGHALAMGAVALLAADLRIGAAGDWKIGLNEVAIGLTLPTFATVLAEERLSVRHRQRAQALAEIYAGAGAVDAGFLDRVVPAADVEREAIAEAAKLAELLHLGAHRATKLRVRRAALAALRESLEEDLASTVAS